MPGTDLTPGAPADAAVEDPELEDQEFDDDDEDDDLDDDEPGDSQDDDDDEDDDLGDDDEPPAPAATPPAEAEFQPASVRAAGQVFSIPGGHLAPEGLFVEQAHVDEVLGLIQRAKHQELVGPQVEQAHQREVQRLTALNEVNLAEATAWTAEMQKITASEDALLAFIEHLAPNLEAMKMRVGQARQAKENEVLRKGISLDEPPQGGDDREFSRNAAITLLDNYDRFVATPELAQLIPADRRDVIWKEIASRAPLYVRTADRDYPEISVKKGERVIDLEAMQGDVRRLAGMFAPAKPSRAQEHNDRQQGRKGRRRRRGPRSRATNTVTPPGGDERPKGKTPLERALAKAEEDE